MIVIGKRSILNSRRQPELFGMRLRSVMVTGIIVDTMFMKLDNSRKGVQERLGFFAFAMSTTFYNCAEAGVSTRALHIHERNRLLEIIVRPLSVHNLDPFSRLSRRKLCSHHVLGRWSRLRCHWFPLLLLLHHPGLVLGRKLLRDVPVRRRIECDARIHRRRSDPCLFPPLLQILHLPGPNPSLLDLVPLLLPREIPIRRNTSSVRFRFSTIRRSGRCREIESPKEHERRFGGQYDSGDMRDYGDRHSEAARDYIYQQMKLFVDHCSLGILL
ncbi:unnamed protein product [Microthlaspi erraticum]|uniref:ABC-2 type transporter transmembrane domain-containing protein n=1 Tax=Microthlaspi erraticum TaxID=1685480 RepID=A0A6D2JYG6_9BRAS|nr:unnamed protein product [Microthlaspi erraticum]